MKRIVLKSPAKINLYLEIINKRPDGYHNIRTLFERVNLCDKITLEAIAEDKIEIFCNNPEVPADKNNLAYRAASLLKKSLGIDSGVRIKIDKSIPLSSGLGGGSSNAASVLLGLNRLWNLKLDKKKLIRYARKLGADIAFFVYEKPFAFGTQRGDIIKPLLIKRIFWHILAVPDIRVSTKEIYEGYSKDLRLTKPRFNIKILTYALSKGDIWTLGSLIYNDLEAATIKKYRRVAKVLAMFRQLGIASCMSGSGSSVFGIALNKETAERIAGSLRRLKDLKVFVVRSC